MLPPPGGRPPVSARGARPTSPAQPAESLPSAPATTTLPAPIEKSGKPKPRQRRAQQLPTQVRRPVSNAEKVALATYEGELGGRQSLIAKLAHAQLDKAGNKFAAVLADPENDLLSLAEICQLTDVSVAKVSGWISASLMAKSTLLATLHIAQGLPDVALGVMEDAKSGERTCGICRGTTQVPSPDPEKSMDCPACQGRGTVRYEPELGLRKVALALGGLLSPAGGVAKGAVTINNLAVAAGGAAGASAGLDRLMEVTDRLMYGVGRDRLASADSEADAEFVEGEVAE